jgi:hypothetical protein
MIAGAVLRLMASLRKVADPCDNARTFMRNVLAHAGKQL